MIFFGFGCGCRLNERDRRLLQGSPLRLSGLSGSSVGEELRFGLRLSGGASRELDSASGTFCERQVFVRTCCASAEFE